jgi:GNAT superfamily N-acetyltransferase
MYSVRPAERKDLDCLLEFWNRVYVHDTRDLERFDRTVFDDPNYDPAGTVVAVDGDRIAGFASCVAREGTKGKDGKGSERDRENAYFKALLYERTDVGRALVERIETFVRSTGKRVIRVVVYGGGAYFFPGIDLRYTDIVSFFKEVGFEQTDVAKDVDLDVAAYEPGQGDYQRGQWGRLRDAGIRVVDYEAAMLREMETFVERVRIPQWFGEGWQSGWKRSRNSVVAVRDKEILGFSSYTPSTGPDGLGGFGSIATLHAERGKGIGTCMMDACIARLKAGGTRRVVAKWANTPFYLPSGWRVCREFAVFSKAV